MCYHQYLHHNCSFAEGCDIGTGTFEVDAVSDPHWAVMNHTYSCTLSAANATLCTPYFEGLLIFLSEVSKPRQNISSSSGSFSGFPFI